MTRKTITALYTQADSSFPDNQSAFITPALLRDFVKDFLDTVRPSYAALSLVSVSVPMTTAYGVFTWTTQIAAQAPDWTTSLASGLITRSDGPASTRISFSCSAVAPNNTILTFTLFVDGVATAWSTSNTSTSATDVQSFAFTAVSYSANLSPNYQIQAKVSVNGNVSLSNGALVCENIPVNVN